MDATFHTESSFSFFFSTFKECTVRKIQHQTRVEWLASCSAGSGFDSWSWRPHTLTEVFCNISQSLQANAITLKQGLRHSWHSVTIPLRIIYLTWLRKHCPMNYKKKINNSLILYPTQHRRNLKFVSFILLSCTPEEKKNNVLFVHWRTDLWFHHSFLR